MKEITPFVHEWDEAGLMPRDIYRKAGEIGLLGVGFPDEYGGMLGDEFYKIIVGEEIARAGSGGVSRCVTYAPARCILTASAYHRLSPPAARI